MPLKRIAVFVSGGGTDLQSILDGIDAGQIQGRVVLVISDKPGAYALTRAQNAGIETWAYEKRQYTKPELEQKLCDILEKYQIDFCVLAGYLSILGASVIRKYPNRAFMAAGCTRECWITALRFPEQLCILWTRAPIRDLSFYRRALRCWTRTTRRAWPIGCWR